MATVTESFKKATSQVTNLVSLGMTALTQRMEQLTKSQTSQYFLPKKSVVVEWDTGSGFSGLYKDKGSLISFDVLRQVAERSMVVAAVVGKLCNRVAAFAQPQKNKYSLGFIVKPNDAKFRRQVKKELQADADDLKNVDSSVMTDAQKRDIASVTDFIMKTGLNSEGRGINERMSFETFLRLITRDRLIYNQIGIECVPTMDKKSISYFAPVSGGSIRFAAPTLKEQISNPEQVIFHSAMSAGTAKDYQEKLKRLRDTDLSEIEYVQVYRGQVYAAFSADELIYRQGIPSVEIVYNGYAPGELELLLNTVANQRIAESHNESFFRFGYANNGILNIKSDMTEEDLQAIKRQFQRQYQGVRNAFKMPILASKEGVDWIQTGQSNKDMEWQSWMHYLIKLITAVYGISPSEINFDIARETASLGDGGVRNEVMLRDTRNSMLRPLLKWIESLINDEILPRWDERLANEYVFEFVGLEYEDKDAELERIKKQVTTYRCINEIRKEEGLPPIEHGDIILDATFVSYKSNKEGQNAMGDAVAPMDGDEDSMDNADSDTRNPDSELPPFDDGDKNEDKLSLALDELVDDFSKKVGSDLRKSELQTQPKLLKVEWYSNGAKRR